jgi:glutamate-1-semialdehyde 2,1-aminomutase
MDRSTRRYALYGLGAVGLGAALAKLRSRLQLSKAKHRSLAGHSRMSRRLASLIPFYEFDEAQFFRADNAPDEVAASRRAGFIRLAQLYQEHFAKTRQLTTEVKESLSDLQFTSTYRVPFQFSRVVREH